MLNKKVARADERIEERKIVIKKEFIDKQVATNNRGYLFLLHSYIYIRINEAIATNA